MPLNNDHFPEQCCCSCGKHSGDGNKQQQVAHYCGVPNGPFRAGWRGTSRQPQKGFAAADHARALSRATGLTPTRGKQEDCRPRQFHAARAANTIAILAFRITFFGWAVPVAAAAAGLVDRP